MDLGLFIGGLVLGFGGGLVCKRNRIEVLPQTFDIGVLGQKHQTKILHEKIEEKERDEKYEIFNGNRYKKK